MVLARRTGQLRALGLSAGWSPRSEVAGATSAPLWTDDHSALVPALLPGAAFDR